MSAKQDRFRARVGFVKDMLVAGNLDSAGAFADWLEEHGNKSDRKVGVLLRRRWKEWKKSRAIAESLDQAEEQRIVGPWLSWIEGAKARGAVIVEATAKAVVSTERTSVDDLFRKYLRTRFPQEAYEAGDPTNSQAYKDS